MTMEYARIEPEVLQFGPNLTVPSYIHVTNRYHEVVTYKTYTNRISHYTVNPYIGLLDPGTSVRIAVSYHTSAGQEDFSTLRDCFSVEVRPLTNWEKRARENPALADEKIPPEFRAKPSSFLRWIWKNTVDGEAKIPPQKCNIKVRFVNIKGGRPGSSPRPSDYTPNTHTAQDGTSPSPRGDFLPPSDRSTTQTADLQRENEQLKDRLTKLKRVHHELYEKNKAESAVADEMRSKTERAGITVPAPVFITAWLVFFYIGLVLDRLLPAEDTTWDV